MNPNSYPDITAYQKAMAQKIWDSLVAVLNSEQLATVRCLEPLCDDSAEACQRKWQGLVTASTVLLLRTETGSETINEALEALNACACA